MSDTLVKMKTGTITKLEQKNSNGTPVVPIQEGTIYFAVDATGNDGKGYGKIVYDNSSNQRIVMSTLAEKADHAVNADYAASDDAGNPIASTYLKKSGGTMTGALTLSGAPTANLHAATKQYVDQSFATNDAMIFKGTIGTGGTVTALPATHNTGWTYRVITAGTYAGVVCEIGDLIICITDGTTANNAHWTVTQTNIDGAVIGPSSATDGNFALFSGTSGKLIQNSSYSPNSFATAGHTHTTSLATGGTSTVNLAANTAYTLTAGGTSVIFKTPAETDPVFTASPAHGITSSNITAWNGKMNTPSGGTAGQVLTKTTSGYGWADASSGGGGGKGQTYTVTTSGNVTINVTNAEGTPVLSVEDVPDVHGGIEKRITAIDISDTSATAEDVVDGKVFYTADGKRTEGVFSGRKWVRPAEFPDLSKMDISGEVLYMSYMANEGNGFCSFRIDTNAGQYTVEIGDIVDDEFVVENTYSINSGSWCQHYFGSQDGGYKVLRVTGSIKAFINQDNQNAVTTVEGEIRNGGESGLVEMYGNLPFISDRFSIRVAHYVQSIVVRNISPISLYYSFQDSYALQNIETKTWNMSFCTSIECAFRACQKLQSIDCRDWDTSSVTSMNNAFKNCFALTDLDVSKWNTESVTNMSETFSATGLKSINVEDWVVDNATSMRATFSDNRSLTRLDLSKWNPSNVQVLADFCTGCYDLAYFFAKNLVTSAATTTDHMFRNCRRLMFKNMDISGWDMSNVTNIQDMFSECYSLEKFPLYNADLSSVTNSGYILSNDQNVFEIVVPASLTSIGAGAFRVATRGCSAIHFKATTPPTLVNTSAFTDMNYGGGRQIVVPYSEDHSILNAYKTATNWSTYAQYIVEESE